MGDNAVATWRCQIAPVDRSGGVWVSWPFRTANTGPGAHAQVASTSYEPVWIATGPPSRAAFVEMPATRWASSGWVTSG